MCVTARDIYEAVRTVWVGGGGNINNEQKLADVVPHLTCRKYEKRQSRKRASRRRYICRIYEVSRRENEHDFREGITIELVFLPMRELLIDGNLVCNCYTVKFDGQLR